MERGLYDLLNSKPRDPVNTDKFPPEYDGKSNTTKYEVPAESETEDESTVLYQPMVATDVVPDDKIVPLGLNPLDV